MQRYGLYKILGDKDAAFEKVAAHYQQVVTEFTAPLRTDDAGWNEIEDYFQRLVNFNKDHPYGCMACNMAVNESSQKTLAAEKHARTTLEIIQSSLKHAIEGAANRGELSKDIDLETVASLLMGTMVASSILISIDARI